MRISTRLQLITFLLLVVVVMLAASLFYTTSVTERLSREHNVMHQLLIDVAELEMLTGDYLLFQEQRAVMQWKQKYESLKAVIPPVSGDDKVKQELLRQIRTCVEKIGNVFTELISQYEQVETEDYNRTNVLATGVKERLRSRMLLMSREILVNSFQLVHMTQHEMKILQQNENNLIIILSFALFAGVVYITISLREFVLSPILLLQKGMKNVGQGDLDFKFGNAEKNEIGDLSRSFDMMTNDLKEVIASRDDSQKEISDRKKAEAELIAKQMILDESQKLAHSGSWELELINDKLYWSDEVFRIFGIEPQNFGASYDDFLDTVHPEDRERVDKAYKRSMQNLSLYDIVHRIVRPDGTIRTIQNRCIHYFGATGKVFRSVGSLVDITELKQAEDALKESEDKYRSMMEAMKDAAYISSPEFRIEYMNPRMISRIGRDAVGESCHKTLYNNEEKCSWCVFDQIQQGEHVEYELADPRDSCYYSISNSPILHSDGLISKLTIFRDITESKAIESQLRQARKMESIGTMAGGIAHDFNNLLYMITGNAELALEDIPEGNSTHANLKAIKTAALRAAGIVEQLLNFSRRTDQELIPIDAITIIKDALKFLRATIPATVEIHKHLPDTEIAIMADPVQINQILMNLCNNASQAMEETGGTLEITVGNESLTEASAQNYPAVTKGEYVKLTVSDTGPGIESEISGRIFDPYFTTKEVGKGSGMGLAVVHGIVKNHLGAITVDSQPGKGTTFTILFPAATEKPEVEAGRPDEVPLGNETVLFVDDEEAITEMTGQILERLGYRVETKLNPVEALELFKTDPEAFDLIITDMTMPQMTGSTLSEKLKAMRPDIPVIICTGHSSLMDAEKAQEMGIDGYVMKPIVKRDLARTIRAVLAKKQEK